MKPSHRRFRVNKYQWEKLGFVFWSLVAVITIFTSMFYDHSLYLLTVGVGLALITEIQRTRSEVLRAITREVSTDE